MAEVFRPVYSVTDPVTGKKSRRKSKTWHVRFYTPDGVRHRVKGYRDKKATETYAAELERRGIRLDAGLVDPADARAKPPLAEHAEDFRRYLAAKGNTSDYVALTFARVQALPIPVFPPGPERRETMTLAATGTDGAAGNAPTNLG